VQYIEIETSKTHMLITKFNYTPKGNFNFINGDNQDVTGEVTLHFKTQELVNNPGRKFIKIPERLWGYQKVTMTNSRNEEIRFDSSIQNKYFTKEVNNKISFVIFSNDYMFFGIFFQQKRAKTKTILANFYFEDNLLGVKIPNNFVMPYFFEIYYNNEKKLVDFIEKNDGDYLLNLEDIKLNDIKKINLIDYRFKLENEINLYTNDRCDSSLEMKLSDIKFNKEGQIQNLDNEVLMGQVGTSHFLISHNFNINSNFFESFREQNDEALELFVINNNLIKSINYEIDSGVKLNKNFYIFKNSIVIKGFRKLIGNIEDKINKVKPLSVKIEYIKAIDEKIVLIFPHKISTIQIFKSNNNLKGPYTELDIHYIENKVVIFTKGIFDDLGLINGIKYMELFANVSLEAEQKSQLYKLKLSDESNLNNEILFNRKISLEGGVGKYKQYVQLFVKENRDLIFLKGPLHNLVKKTFNWTVQVENIKRDKNKYELYLKVSEKNIKYDEIKFQRLINRNVLDPKENNYKIYSKNQSTIFKSIIDLEHDYVPFYWDVFVVFKKNGEFLPLQVDKLSEDVRKIMDIDVFKKEIRTQNNNILYPYITAGGSLAFTFRKVEAYETSVNFKKEILAFNLYNLLKKFFDSKNIWIIFEKNSFGAHDNGFHFFKYMYENEKHPNTYFVIRKDSPELKNLKNMEDKIIYFMSFKYFIYMFAAKVFISSDTKFHSYNLQRRDSLLAKSMMHKKNVFLQHGMNGIKKVPVFHKKRGLLDLIISPSNFERENINIKKWGYSPNEVVATGYARWDSYFDKTGMLSYRQIFMMPTWRKSMEGISREEFITTKFYKEYQAFLNSPRLKEVMLKNNVRLAFFLHPYFKNYVDLFTIDDSFVDKHEYLDVDMGEEIMRSSMMISDYSSVLWDMFYLKKPVLFYQFDQSDYLKSEGSYLDYDRELFGDVVFDADSVVQKVIEYIDSDFSEKPEYSVMRNKYMNFHDHNNSERIYKAILSKKKLLGIENNWTFWRRVTRKLWKIKKKIKIIIQKLLGKN